MFKGELKKKIKESLKENECLKAVQYMYLNSVCNHDEDHDFNIFN